MGGMATYKALATCHIGGLREPGDVFRWNRFEKCPAHLEEMPEAPGPAVAVASETEAPGPTLADVETVHTVDAGGKGRKHK